VPFDVPYVIYCQAHLVGLPEQAHAEDLLSFHVENLQRPILTVQGELLAFFGQEIVAHAATLIATLAAAFLFMSSFRWTRIWPKCVRSLAGRLLCWVIGGGLLSMAIYVLFRIMWYGQLVFAMTEFATCDKIEVLSVYNRCVMQDTITNLTQRDGLYQLILLFSSSYSDIRGILFALFFGFLLAGLVLFLLDPLQDRRDC
jgi:hypothetical protein